MPLSPDLTAPHMHLYEWMRLTTRKFHFLKVETIVVDTPLLHKPISRSANSIDWDRLVK